MTMFVSGSDGRTSDVGQKWAKRVGVGCEFAAAAQMMIERVQIPRPQECPIGASAAEACESPRPRPHRTS